MKRESRQTKLPEAFAKAAQDAQATERSPARRSPPPLHVPHLVSRNYLHARLHEATDAPLGKDALDELERRMKVHFERELRRTVRAHEEDAKRRGRRSNVRARHVRGDEGARLAGLTQAHGFNEDLEEAREAAERRREGES